MQPTGSRAIFISHPELRRSLWITVHIRHAGQDTQLLLPCSLSNRDFCAGPSSRRLPTGHRYVSVSRRTFSCERPWMTGLPTATWLQQWNGSSVASRKGRNWLEPTPRP
jgi:hypothetical protein